MIQGTASVQAATILVDALTEPHGLLLTATYELAAVDPRDKRPLAIDFRFCPLLPTSITCSAAAPRWDFHSKAAWRWGWGRPAQASVVQLPLAAGATWHGATVEIRLRWDGKQSRPALVEDPFLDLRGELPKLAEWPDVFKLPQSQIRLSESAATLAVGYVAARLNAPTGTGGPHLQAILCLGSTPQVQGPSGAWPEICLTGVDERVLSPGRAETVCAMITSIAEFFADRLSARPSMRVAAALDSTEKTLGGSFGPFLAVPAAWYGDPAHEMAGHAMGVATRLAPSWWGCGCGINGVDGSELAVAIGWAGALVWGEIHAPRRFFDEMLALYRARAKALMSGQSPLRSKEIHRLIGLPLYEWLRGDEARWESLRQLTQHAWGTWVDAETVVDVIRSAGLDLRPVCSMARHAVQESA